MNDLRCLAWATVYPPFLLSRLYVQGVFLHDRRSSLMRKKSARYVTWDSGNVTFEWTGLVQSENITNFNTLMIFRKYSSFESWTKVSTAYFLQTHQRMIISKSLFFWNFYAFWDYSSTTELESRYNGNPFCFYQILRKFTWLCSTNSWCSPA